MHDETADGGKPSPGLMIAGCSRPCVWPVEPWSSSCSNPVVALIAPGQQGLYEQEPDFKLLKALPFAVFVPVRLAERASRTTGDG